MSANENGLDSREVQPVKTITQSTDTADFNADRYATLLIAKLEKAGHHVSRLESGFLVTRWGMSRHCPDYAALVNFGRVLGVTL